MVLRQVTSGQSGLPTPTSTASYWHKHPSPTLLSHRTTPSLPPTADTIIIGSGMTAAFAARSLASSSSNRSILVLEAREACWGATGRNGGHCQPFLYGTSAAVAKFELDTYFFLQKLIAENEIACDWRSLRGGAHAILSQRLFDAARDAIARLQQTTDLVVAVGPKGVEGGPQQPEWARGLTLEKLRLDRDGVCGAIVQRHAASLWPYKLVCWVWEQLLGTNSVNLQTNTPVTALSQQQEEGLWSVTTPRGTVTARQVLLATNAYTSRLVPGFADLIVPVRGQVGALLAPKPVVGLEYSYVFFGELRGEEDGEAASRDEYLVQRPLPNGELILGGGRHVARGTAVGEWRDDEVEARVARWLRTELAPVLRLGDGGKEKEEQELEASMEWTGIMGFSRDQMPWVGAVPAALGGGEGLYVAAGFTGHGMPRCALAGRGVAAMMCGEEEHGLPGEFLASEERVQRAREQWGPVGSVDEIEALLADLKA